MSRPVPSSDVFHGLEHFRHERRARANERRPNRPRTNANGRVGGPEAACAERVVFELVSVIAPAFRLCSRPRRCAGWRVLRERRHGEKDKSPPTHHLFDRFMRITPLPPGWNSPLELQYKCTCLRPLGQRVWASPRRLGVSADSPSQTSETTQGSRRVTASTNRPGPRRRRRARRHSPRELRCRHSVPVPEGQAEEGVPRGRVRPPART